MSVIIFRAYLQAEISDYFLVQGVEAGDRFVEQFEQKCQYLAQFP